MLELTAAGLKLNGSTNLFELGLKATASSAAGDGPVTEKLRTDVTPPELEDEAAKWKSAGWIVPDSAADHRNAAAAIVDSNEGTTVVEAPAAAMTEEMTEWKPANWYSSSSHSGNDHANGWTQYTSRESSDTAWQPQSSQDDTWHRQWSSSNWSSSETTAPVSQPVRFQPQPARDIASG